MMKRLILCSVLAALAATMPPAAAAFPGSRGLIAYGHEEHIFTLDPSKDDEPMQITAEGVNKSPAWSPSGERLAWTCDGDLCIGNADGSDAEVLLASPDR